MGLFGMKTKGEIIVAAKETVIRAQVIRKMNSREINAHDNYDFCLMFSSHLDMFNLRRQSLHEGMKSFLG